MPLGRGSGPDDDEEFAATVQEITTVRPETNTLTDPALETTTAELAPTSKVPEVTTSTGSPFTPATPPNGLFYPSSYYDPSNTLIDMIYITTERASMESTANAMRAKKSANEVVQPLRPEIDKTDVFSRPILTLEEVKVGKGVNDIPEPQRRKTLTRNHKPTRQSPKIEIPRTPLERSKPTRLPTPKSPTIMSNLIVMNEVYNPITEQRTSDSTDTTDHFESETSISASSNTERSEENPKSAEDVALIEQSPNDTTMTTIKDQGVNGSNPKASATSKSIWPGLTPPYAYARVYGYPASAQTPSLWQFINEPIKKGPSIFIPSQQFEVDGYDRFIPIPGK